jgi:hypothetical protein
MTDERGSNEDPTGEEAPHRSPQEVAEKAESHEYPTTGRGGDMTSDDESLARRPAQDEDEIDGDAEKGGTPPGTATRGA